MGIEELKDVIVFVARLGNGLGRASEDGVFELSDLLHLGPALAASFAAGSGISKVPAELADLDDAEQKEVVAIFKAELDVPQEDAEKIAEAGFPVVLQLAKMVALWQKAP